METVRKINDELAIAGPVTFLQLKQLAEEGFQAVLNLRSLDADRLSEEQRYAEHLGMEYVHFAIDTAVIDAGIAAKVLQQIEELPKPILVYCKNSMLAAAMVLMLIAMRQGETLEQAFRRAESLGLFSALVQA